MAATDSDIQASGGDYTTIAAWHSAVPTNPSGQQRGLLAAEEFVHTADEILNGKTPTSGNEVILTTQADAAFNDVAPIDFTGYLNTSKARITASSNTVTLLDIDDDYTQVINVQFHNTSTATSGDSLIRMNRLNQLVMDCLLVSTMDNSNGMLWMEHATSSNWAVNVICINEHTGVGAENTFGVETGNNCIGCVAVTIGSISDTNGIGFRRWTGPAWLQNCVSMGYNQDFGSTTGWGESDYNASSDATAPDFNSNGVLNATYDHQFNNIENDFTIRVNSDLIGAGSRHATYSDDVLGRARPSPCAMGWIEHIPDRTERLTTITEWTTSATVSSVSQSHTVDANASVLFLAIGLEAHLSITTAPTWNTTENFELVDQTTSSGLAGDKTHYLYMLRNPTTGTHTIAYTAGEDDHGYFVAWQYYGTETASLAATITFLSEDVNDSATSTSVHSPAEGATGKTLIFCGVWRGGDGDPASNASGYFEIANGATGTNTNNDASFYVADLIRGAPDAITVTWNGSDENGSHHFALTTKPSSVTVALTGQAITGGLGAFGVDRDKALTGVEITSGLGSVSAKTSVLVTGQEVTGALGALAVEHSVALSGEEITAALGTVTPTIGGDVSVALTGQAMTAQLGNVGVSLSKELSGIEITSAQGAFGKTQVVPLPGEEITGELGSVVSERNVPLSGEEITAALGLLSVVFDKDLTGLEFTGAQGTLSPDHSKALLGLEITGGLGTVTAQIGGDVSVALTGLSMTGQLGVLGVQRGKEITGEELSAALGTLGITHSQVLAGQEITAALGALGLTRSNPLTGEEITAGQGLFGVGLSKALAGVEITAEQGSFGVDHSKVLTGAEITGGLGTLGVQIGSNVTVALTGLQMTFQQGVLGVVNTGEVEEGVDSYYRRRRWRDLENRRKVTTSSSGFSNRRINVRIQK